MSFTDVGKSRPSREFLTSQICLLTLFAKISEFIVYCMKNSSTYFVSFDYQSKTNCETALSVHQKSIQVLP